MTLRLGLYLPTWHLAGGGASAWPELRSLARDAESLGVDTLWVADEPGIAWECWTILSALAEATERVRIGPLVTCTRYREPALLATMARTLDEVSGGRLVLGLGSGVGPGDGRWPAFGWDAANHVSRFGEAVEIVARLLHDGPIAFEGRFYRLAPPGPSLGPAEARPAPPIWVAGARPRTMAVAARWGDAVNGGSALTDAVSVGALRTAVDAACASVGRDPASIALTGWTRLAVSADGRLGRERDDTIAGTVEEVAGRLLEVHRTGVEHLTCFVGDETDERAFPALTRDALERFAAVVEAVRAAG